jgi:hypothetical protein
VKQPPDREDVCWQLHYEPLTGVFHWRGGQRKGKRAGTKHARGYRQIRLNGWLYMEHQLAWLMAYGDWPAMLDHKNLDKSDNRLENLRLATLGQNRANITAQKNNKLGVKGVRRDSGGWVARIRRNGKLIHLGTYRSIDEASKAYYRAAVGIYGEFARA